MGTGTVLLQDLAGDLYFISELFSTFFYFSLRFNPTDHSVSDR
jgi:hypothetical protein